jgi:hypothetical protein
MSVTIRPYRRGGWEVDIRVVTPDGTREHRVRKRAPMSARSAAVRWAEGRERVLFERLMKPPQNNAPPPTRAVPGRWSAADAADGAVPRATGKPTREVDGGRRTHPSSHLLFSSGDARRAAEGDPGARRTSRARHDAAVHASESGGVGQCDSAARSAFGLADFWRPGGDGEGVRRKDQWLEQLNWR